MDTQSLPVNKLATPGEGAMHYDPGHFEIESANRVSADDAARSSFLAKRYAIYHGSTSDTVLGRVSDAASSIVLTRDEQGNRRLNTTYLLRVVTASVAHSAYRPYGRRSAAQPISDFGSTVGSDAGMNVLHEFEPGIRQLVKVTNRGSCPESANTSVINETYPTRGVVRRRMHIPSFANCLSRLLKRAITENTG
jgi:hypothetical protein